MSAITYYQSEGILGTHWVGFYAGAKSGVLVVKNYRMAVSRREGAERKTESGDPEKEAFFPRQCCICS